MASELVDYLTTLISPPDERVAYWEDVNAVDLSTTPENTLYGLVARGVPTPEQAAAILRVLRPGAHVCLLSPEGDRTGHRGACRMEDQGFEVRDTIMVVDRPEMVHYVPKAATSEREAGCEGIKEEGKARGNTHVTVKPIKVMERLLTDVDQPVLDPFLGSGTTGLACILQGMDFIGIERSAEYRKIIDARVAHWKKERVKQVAESRKAKAREAMMDMFGGE